MGSVGLAAFALAVWQMAPRHGMALVLTTATTVWFATGFLMWFACKRMGRMARQRMRAHQHACVGIRRPAHLQFPGAGGFDSQAFPL
jgi:hypothetical protein